jgi:hypothetical protein
MYITETETRVPRDRQAARPGVWLSGLNVEKQDLELCGVFWKAHRLSLLCVSFAVNVVILTLPASAGIEHSFAT